MKAKKTFIKVANQAAREYFSSEKKTDLSELEWDRVRERIKHNLTVIRQIYGMSQQHCADLLGLNPKYVNAMEKGRYFASLRCVWLFSQLFHIPIELIVEKEWSDEECEVWKAALKKVEHAKKRHRELYENVRHNIIALRYAYCLNQNEIAALLGLSNSYMWALEKGRYRISLPIAYAVCRLFDVSLDEFVYSQFSDTVVSPFEPRKNTLRRVPKAEWMQMNQVVTDTVKRLRNEKQLSVQGLADELGYGRDALYKMIQGKTFLHLEIIADIAQYFNVSLDMLVSKNQHK